MDLHAARKQGLLLDRVVEQINANSSLDNSKRYCVNSTVAGPITELHKNFFK